MYGMVLYSTVWHSVAWRGTVWHSLARSGTVWYGLAQCGTVWYGMIRYGMVWYGLVWYGIVLYAMCRRANEYVHVWLIWFTEFLSSHVQPHFQTVRWGMKHKA